MIRKLKCKDAFFMLEWMKDRDINSIFSVNFAEYTEKKVIDFIEHSFTEVNQHFAVVNENDEYQGTISLKNISEKDKNAEYAVVFRKCAQGTGIAQEATKEILKYAFCELNLEKVYLNVLEENIRARKFYEKMGFQKEGIFMNHKFIGNEFKNLWWFGMLKENFNIED